MRYFIKIWATDTRHGTPWPCALMVVQGDINEDYYAPTRYRKVAWDQRYDARKGEITAFHRDNVDDLMEAAIWIAEVNNEYIIDIDIVPIT